MSQSHIRRRLIKLKPFEFSLILVALALISCGSTTTPLSSDDFIGTWIGKSYATGVEALAIVEFYPDGTFEAKDFPEILVRLYDVSLLDSMVDGEGKWQLENVEGEEVLLLYFDKIDGEKPGFNLPLKMNFLGGDCFLYDFVGDPDLGERYCFVQEE